MPRLSNTFRRLISCLLLMMLVLQGVAQAGTAYLPQAHMEEHCAGHAAAQECLCCSDAMAITGGCAALCSVSMAVSAAVLSVSRVSTDEHRRIAVHGSSGPVYIPLNPPPIS